MNVAQAIDGWVDAPGSVIFWDPSLATLAKVREAPISPVPASYQQAQHLRCYCEHAAEGIEMSRLFIPAWNVAGRCDVRAMTYVVNTYLRRHDTYRSWFDYKDAEHIVRRTLEDPADIELVATRAGEMTPAEWRKHILATPGPLQWNCFRFGVIQRANHFTFFAAVDHLHTDAMLMGTLFSEIHDMYTALQAGGAPISLPPAGNYEDYCIRQRAYTSGLTSRSPEVRAWIEFAENNGGTLPRFRLPLGDPLMSGASALLTAQLLDNEQTDRFESACRDEGVRFSGGVFACAALAEHHLTGTATYYVVTPTTTRRSPDEFMTTGWFTGLVPITVPVGVTSFGDTARAAQASFDSRVNLARLPFDRVLELASPERGLSQAQPFVPMLSYMEAGLPPLSPAAISRWREANGRLYSDLGFAGQIGIWVNRLGEGTTVTVGFPDNPIARESIARYVDALKSSFVRVVECRGCVTPPVATHPSSSKTGFVSSGAPRSLTR